MEYTRGIDSRFPVSELANKIKEKGVKDKKIKKNIYQVEYEVRKGSDSFGTPGRGRHSKSGCRREEFKQE